MPTIFDSHAHYDDEAFDADRDPLLEGLFDVGRNYPVSEIVNAGSSVASSRKSLRLAERYPRLFAAVGVHPEEAAAMTDADLDEIRRLADHPKTVAIGEIGLDYHYEDACPRDVQLHWFRRQLELARELQMPVILHDREAHGDMLDTLAAYFPAGSGKIERAGVLHCFSGSVEMAEEVIRRGFCIGLGGAVTFKNARRAVEVVSALPSDALLLETDAPYMAPVPYRGRRCDSGMIAPPPPGSRRSGGGQSAPCSTRPEKTPAGLFGMASGITGDRRQCIGGGLGFYSRYFSRYQSSTLGSPVSRVYSVR